MTVKDAMVKNYMERVQFNIPEWYKKLMETNLHEWVLVKQNEDKSLDFISVHKTMDDDRVLLFKVSTIEEDVSKMIENTLKNMKVMK